MSRFSRLAPCAAGFALLLASASAAAQYPGYSYTYHQRDARLYGGLWLGFAGELDAGRGDRLGLVGSRELTTSLGGQAGLEFVLLRHVAFGGEVRVGRFNTRGGDAADVDRSWLIDIDFKPRFRVVPPRLPLDIYATLPIGMTIARFAKQLPDYDEKLGWNIGAGAGLTVFVTHSIGLNVEPIWLMHRFKVETPSGNVPVTLQQFSLLLNAVIGF